MSFYVDKRALHSVSADYDDFGHSRSAGEGTADRPPISIYGEYGDLPEVFWEKADQCVSTRR